MTYGGTEMKTEKLWISGDVRRNMDMEDILQEFAEKTDIRGRDYLHLCLLAEETVGMAQQLMHHFDGEIWVEHADDGDRIILEAEVQESRDDSVIPRKTPNGFMAKIAEMLNCAYVFEDREAIPQDMTGMLPEFISYGIHERKESPVWAGRWSLSAYREECRRLHDCDASAQNALDELEKSIVASLSREVTVGIEGHTVRLVITI